MQTVSQGSREARQPWALLSNRFAVLLLRALTCSEVPLVCDCWFGESHNHRLKSVRLTLLLSQC